jgi:hypothetical protein
MTEDCTLTISHIERVTILAQSESKVNIEICERFADVCFFMGLVYFYYKIKLKKRNYQMKTVSAVLCLHVTVFMLLTYDWQTSKLEPRVA